ncbi:hypothetical protein Y032_0008g266 [Ancylostoma ceylanicum]|uniref:BED-type domain-containing protein n=1 Tax=Ancylostoma ceylanicum TaxID=53326 RepID=A0A016VMF8_9BILA|nr:hypothetical protein Y032_0008g266 [Ancylostoma ceylanicum]
MSVVWNLYKKMKGESGEDLAVCKICSKTVRIPKSKTTTNLLSHLRESHKEEMEDAQTTTLKENTIVETQPKLDELFKRKISSSTKRRLDHKVALLVAKGSLPLNIVSLDVFKDLLATLNPSYSPPCTKTLLSIMRDQVKALDEANKVVCKQEGCNIAVTVDSWSSSNANCSLLAITGHITGADITDRRNILIDCIPLQGESHTAVVLEAKFRESIERLGISPAQISCIVADGASVMKAMASNLDLRYVQCCAHVINLAVRAALESDAAKMAINNVKKIVSRFLKEAGLPLALPVTDCPTRWGSTYTMVCDVLNSLPALENLLLELKMAPFEAGELRLLEAIQVFLAPFYTMTKQVCYQDSCVSMYIPVGKILIASTKKNCQAARREAKQFGECLLSKLWHYFDEWFEDEDLSIAAFCDPRFAFLDTVLPAESWRTTVEKFIASKAKSTEPKEIEDLLDRTAIHHGERDDGEAPVWNLLTTQPSSSRESTTTEDEIQIEVQQYAVLLKKSRPSYESDPVEWWRNHCKEFPLIAESVPKYLVAPATSVDCERLFSLAGIIYGNKRRGHLKGENARLLLMLKVNSNEKVGRASKAWNTTEAKKYGRVRPMEQVYDGSTTEEELSTSEDEDEELL